MDLERLKATFCVLFRDGVAYYVPMNERIALKRAKTSVLR